MKKVAFPKGCWITWDENPPGVMGYGLVVDPFDARLHPDACACVAQVAEVDLFKMGVQGYKLRNCAGEVSPEMGWWNHDWLVKKGARRCTVEEQRTAETALMAALL